MKKTLLLSALVASVASFASTTGSVEFYNDNASFHVKGISLTDVVKTTKSTFGIKGEVKVNESGFSAGGDLKVKDYMLFMESSKGHDLLKKALMKESKVWAKYELPQLKGVDTYVKGTYNVSGSVEIEADAKYKKGDLTVELNSKTSLPLGTPKIVYKAASKDAVAAAIEASNIHGVQHSYLEKVVSTHKLSVEKEKLSVISDLKASVEVQHAYAAELVAKKTDKDKQGNYNEFLNDGEKGTYNSAFKYVKAEVSGAYKEAKNLEVKGELGLAYTPHENKGFRVDGKYVGSGDMLNIRELDIPVIEEKSKIISDANKEIDKLKAESGDKNEEINKEKVKIEEAHNAIKETKVVKYFMNLAYDPLSYSNDLFGFTGKFSDKAFIEAKYTGVKDLELTGRVRLVHSVNSKELTIDKKVSVNEHNILFDVKAGAKYTGIKNTTLAGSLDFLLISPESKIVDHNNAIKSERNNFISLVADLSAKYDYKATDKLTVSPELNVKGILVNPIDKESNNILALVVSPKVSVEYKPTEKLTLNGSVETPVAFGKVPVLGSSYFATSFKTNFNVKYAW